MRIAVVLNTSWNIYNFRMGLINHLVRSGHQVVAIAPKDSYTRHITDAGCEFINLTMDSRGINPVKDAALTFELYRIYKELDPDIILHFTIKPNIYGSIAARTLRIPVVNNVSGLGTVFLWETFASSLALWMYKIAFASADFVFFQNADDEQHFLKRVGIKDLKTGILPGSGINISEYKPSGFKKKKEFTFLLIARLLIDKGIEEFVDAVKILKQKGVEARFQLLGNIETRHKRGIDLERVKSWISEGLIEYKGTTDNVIPFIERADCIVLPSYREGTPRTLLEGASLGKPLIATDVPGCNNIVNHGQNGFLCELKNPGDLAGQMHKMLSLTEEEIAVMGDESRRLVVEKYDEKIVIEKYEDIINDLCKTPKVSSGTHQKSKGFHSRAAAVNL